MTSEQATPGPGDVAVHDRPDRSRFELIVDGEPAGHLQYRREGSLFALPHTEVEPRFGGRGLGGRLVAAALDDLRSRNAQVLPDCPFVAHFIRAHGDYADLVPVAERSRYGIDG